MSPPDPLLACNATVAGLEARLDACGCGPASPCSKGSSATDSDLGLHIAAVFIILGCSLLGAALPLLSLRYSFGGDGYVVCLGKLVGTGIVLACALVHMLQPAASSLADVCVPEEFSSGYAAYAYLFAMLAALLMHWFETMVRFAVTQDGDDDDVEKRQSQDTHLKHSDVMHHMIQSITMELALTVHSVFIGLVVGVVGSAELTALLTALCFHQFFEGVALGSRLADAGMTFRSNAAFVAVFAASAPVGIAVGILLTQNVDPEGVTYLLVQGVLDGCCAGLLLYVGFQLLLIDFPEDMAVLCSSHPQRNRRRAGMFVALWTGAGFMALLGKYL